jgi:polyisoprenyl-phosphate glycosyltransferase
MSTTERSLRLLSVVAPMLDEELVAEEFHRRVAAALDGLPWELVLVDDGSTDATPRLLDEIASRDPRVRVLRLSRPFGHQLALSAGLEHARGDAVVMLDADLQDPPELIPELLDRWRDGADVVIAKRRRREGETRFKLLTARAFYAAVGRLAQVRLEPEAGDFRLMSRRALDGLLQMPERVRFLRGMTSWVGFRQELVEFDRSERFAGHTKYPLRKMVRFAIDGVAAFSHVPLQVAMWLGFGCAALAFLGLPLTIVARASDIYVPGVSSLLFVVLLIGGLQLMTLGLIGEYVGRIYEEVKRRPLYVVAERRNFDEDERPERQREHVRAG